MILAYSTFTPLTATFTTEICLHRHQVQAGALSPNGQWLLSIPYHSEDEISPYTVNLSDLTTGQRVRIFRNNNVKVSTCAISDNEVFVVVGSHQGDIFLWNTHSAKLATTLTGHTNLINSCRFFLADTRILSGSDDQTMRIWTATGICTHVLRAFSEVKDTAVSKNNIFIASTLHNDYYPGIVRIWECVTGNQYQTFFHDDEIIRGSCVFSPDSKLLGSMASESGEAKVWDLQKTKVLQTCIAQKGRTGYRICHLTTDHLFWANTEQLGLYNFRTGTSIYRFDTKIRFVDVFGGGQFIITVGGENDKPPIVQIRCFKSGKLIN